MNRISVPKCCLKLSNGLIILKVPIAVVSGSVTGPVQNWKEQLFKLL